MTAKTKPNWVNRKVHATDAERRRAKRATNRAYEARRRQAGTVCRNVRLSPEAAKTLDALIAELGCCGQDVIEGLLLGTVSVATSAAATVRAVMREHRLSVVEARAFVAGELA